MDTYQNTNAHAYAHPNTDMDTYPDWYAHPHMDADQNAFGAAGLHTEAERETATTGDSHSSGPSGANGSVLDIGADL